MPASDGLRRRALGFSRELALRLRLNETVPLVSLAAVGFFGWAFVKLAGEVMEGDTAGLDRAILLSLRQPGNIAEPLGPTWFQEAARDMTALGGHTILGMITLATLAFLVMAGKQRMALLVLAAVGGGMIASALLKIGFERPRPDLVPHATRVYTASFPSGHSMLSAVTYLTLGALLAQAQPTRRLRAFFLGLALVLTVMVGASRIYLGVHWPSDVLAGWCGGAAWAGLCWFVELQLQQRGQVEGPADPP